MSPWKTFLQNPEQNLPGAPVVSVTHNKSKKWLFLTIVFAFILTVVSFWFTFHWEYLRVDCSPSVICEPLPVLKFGWPFEFLYGIYGIENSFDFSFAIIADFAFWSMVAWLLMKLGRKLISK